MSKKPSRSLFRIPFSLLMMGLIFGITVFMFLLISVIPFPWTTSNDPAYNPQTDSCYNPGTFSLLCFDAPTAGLAVSQDFSLDFNFEREDSLNFGEQLVFHHLTYQDKYSLQNTSSNDITLRLYYPFYCIAPDTLALTFQVNGQSVSAEPIVYGNVSANTEAGWMTLHKRIQNGNLQNAIENNNPEAALSTGFESLWYFPLEVTIPSGDTITVTATWVSTEKSDRVSITYNLLDELPCQSRTVTLWNYDCVMIEDQNLDFDLEAGQNQSTIGSFGQNAYFVYSTLSQPIG